MLGAYLSTREKLWGIYTFTEWRVRVKPNRFRIPDLTVVKGSWPKDRVLEQSAFLVVEIWSPDASRASCKTRFAITANSAFPTSW
jgi:Uma2 family endonuclease